MLKTSSIKLPRILLLVDDAVIILFITLVGIRFHQTDTTLLGRLPYTFFPFLAAWYFFAAPLRLYDPATASKWAQLWRVPAAAVFAAPIGAALRSFWLNTPLVPVFVVVMGTALCIGILISRSVFILVFRDRWPESGNG